MGLFSGMMGNATEVDVEKVKNNFQEIVFPGEEVERAYKVIRDLFVFTNKRLVLVDKQGVTGKKVAYHSIPYKSIRHFSVESAGHFDLDAELKIWVAGMQMPVKKQFNKNVNIYEVQQTLASYVLE